MLTKSIYIVLHLISRLLFFHQHHLQPLNLLLQGVLVFFTRRHIYARIPILLAKRLSVCLIISLLKLLLVIHPLLAEIYSIRVDIDYISRLMLFLLLHCHLGDELVVLSMLLLELLYFPFIMVNMMRHFDGLFNIVFFLSLQNHHTIL